MNRFRSDQGSVTLEAVMVLPAFVCLTMLLISIVQLALTEMALKAAVSEAVKVTAANMYPVEVLYEAGKASLGQTQAGEWLRYAAEQAAAAKQTVVNAETFVSNYAHFLPEPLVRMTEWELKKREELERAGAAAKEEAIKRTLYPLLQPVLYSFANSRILQSRHLQITEVQFPDFENKDRAYFGIEAQYELKLAVPFFRKSVVIKKKALEKVWTGGNQ